MRLRVPGAPTAAPAGNLRLCLHRPRRELRLQIGNALEQRFDQEKITPANGANQCLVGDFRSAVRALHLFEHR